MFLKPGDLARPVLKARGLRPGEKIQTLRAPIRIVEVRREPLRAMLDDPGYGYDKVRREGSKGDARHGKRDAWVRMYCASHKGATRRKASLPGLGSSTPANSRMETSDKTVRMKTLLDGSGSVGFPGMHWAAWVKTGAKKPAGLVVNRLDGFLGQCLALRVVFFLAA